MSQIRGRIGETDQIRVSHKNRNSSRSSSSSFLSFFPLQPNNISSILRISHRFSPITLVLLNIYFL